GFALILTLLAIDRPSPHSSTSPA
ncbi:MAG: hypothetical protein JWL70_3191, partial [Acidimicrobiia bacterium]|nr:hypothetical protein [Acidimicrobiia bacterium]